MERRLAFGSDGAMASDHGEREKDENRNGGFISSYEKVNFTDWIRKIWKTCGHETG